MRVEGSQLNSYKIDGPTGTSEQTKLTLLKGDSVGVKPEPETHYLEKKEITRAELAKKVKQLNKAAEALDRRFQYTIHEGTHRIMVKVFRKDNDELIAEIPPERILDVLAKIDKEMGLLVDAKA
ncbi:MAG: flagellar protein FlaG [Bacillota bacterium]|jgi:flagellar protein FlaG